MTSSLRLDERPRDLDPMVGDQLHQGIDLAVQDGSGGQGIDALALGLAAVRVVNFVLTIAAVLGNEAEKAATHGK